MVEFNEFGLSRGASGKSVKKFSNNGWIVKKCKKSQRFKKFAKVIGLEECLLKYQSFVN